MCQVFYVWFYGLGVYFLSFGMTYGIVTPINALMLEHWLYFGLFGFFTILAWYLDIIWTYCKKHWPKLNLVLISIFVVFCLFLGYITIQRNLIWANEIGMYENILLYNPNNALTLINLGNIYFKQRDYENAKIYWQKAISADPYNPTEYSSLGGLFMEQGQYEIAHAWLKKSIEVDATYPFSYLNLSELYLRENNTPLALETLEKLQKINPTSLASEAIDSIKNLGTSTPLIPDKSGFEIIQ